jgi:hypothetical protein
MLGTGINLRDVNYFGGFPDPIAACLQYNNKLPSTFNEFLSDQKAKAFFILLSRGDSVSELIGNDPSHPNDIYTDIKNLATDPENNESNYQNYLSNYQSHYLLQNKGYRYTIN